MTNKVEFLLLDNVAEALAAQPSDVNRKRYEKTQRERGYTWYGPECNTAQAARDLYRTGWQDGARRVSEIQTNELRAARSIRRRRVWTDQGDEIDIHRVYSGRLDQAWRRPLPRNVAGPQNVTILVNAGVNCNRDTEFLFPRGAAAAKLADILSEAGYNVGILAAVASIGLDCNGKRDFFPMIPLKRHGDPMDLGNVAAGLCHTGFFRTVGFALLCGRPYQVSDSLGRSPTSNEQMQPAIDWLAQQGEHVIACPVEIEGTRAAAEWVNAEVDKIDGQAQAA